MEEEKKGYEVALEKQGPNIRARWTAVLTEVEKERRLVNGMFKAGRNYLNMGRREDWEIALLRGAEWEVEWTEAKDREKRESGEDTREKIKKRKRVALPQVTDDQLRKWRGLERQAGLQPMLRLGETKVNLHPPADGDNPREVCFEHAFIVELWRLP